MNEEFMRTILLILMTLSLAACGKSNDKYLGFWQLENTTYPKILEIRKEGKDTYLVNENIFRDDEAGKAKKEMVLDKTENGLGVNNGLAVIPFNLSEDSKTLRIREQKYSKISEAQARSLVKNKKDCDKLKANLYEEKKPFDGFFFGDNPNQAKLDTVKAKYRELQKQIPACDFNI
ncbi:hypothetical protein ACF3NA_10875 [Alkanindiges sp. WGS2144]|uniref:hypothetical protein n=1 Tax=Alkanindiges sp. WGS2144 TaxID=3366808 RepID=UPI00375251E7